jgi:predicted kinase
MSLDGKIVISGAPGTGKTTVGGFVADALGFPFLSLDAIKETLGDRLGTGDEEWSDLMGDTAAEVIFRLTGTFPSVVVEGWWRRKRRERALREFHGCIEVFCHCEPALAESRMRARHDVGRHPIHRDVINPGMLDRAAHLAQTVVPLGLGSVLIEVDSTVGVDRDELISDVRAALNNVR